MRGKTVLRCYRCGRRIEPGRNICDRHFMARIVKFGPGHAVGWIYLCKEADRGLAGEQLDEFCRLFDHEEHRRIWPGPTRKQMEEALRWARKWTDHGLREFRETGVPEVPVGPEGLFGRPQGPAGL